MRKIQAFWGAAAGVLILVGLALCALGLGRGTLLVKAEMNPGRVVSAFFDELSAGDLDAAYERLSNYRSLGLENRPRTEDGKALLLALRRSYNCNLLVGSEQRGEEAVQNIELRFLDLDALEARINSGEAADLNEALSAADELTAKGEFSVKLHFDGTAWRIELDQDLLNAIQGHVSGEGAV